jgi:phosphoribosyl-ATP pyrophosphohydrolase
MSLFLQTLENLIADRKARPQPGSYTNQLLDGGRAAAAQKVGEEAVEVVIAALAQEKERLVEESADLLYHLLVLLADADVALAEVMAELQRRHQR